MFLSIEEIEQGRETQLAVLYRSFKSQVRAEASRFDFVDNDRVNQVPRNILCYSVQVDFVREIADQPQTLLELLQLLEAWLSGFDLDFEACSKLALDVLRAAKATEDTTACQDPHLGRESFCFLHRVAGEDDCAFLFTL